MSAMGGSDWVLLGFLAGQRPDAAGRTVAEVLLFEDARIEGLHDFIQWLFPLPEPSLAVPGSPFLRPGEAAAIRADETACRAIDAAAEVMASFYERNDHWLVPHDHNHLRITRIIRALRLLRGREPARAFFDRVARRAATPGARVSPTSLAYWRAAL